MNVKFIGSVIAAALFVYWGVRHLRFSLPDVRSRVQAGTALAGDLARLKKERMAGFCFIAVGVCILLSQIFSLFGK
jgi:hypothetical protein